MLTNLRWLMFFLGVGAAVWGGVIAWRSFHVAAGKKTSRSERLSRQSLATALAGLILAWLAAEIWPFGPWHPIPPGIRSWLRRVPEPDVLLACVAYLAIVAASSRGLIGMPQYRVLQSRADELKGVASTAAEQLPAGPQREATENHWKARINRAEEAAAYRFLGVVVSIPLPSVARAARTFNTIERQILSAFSGDDLRLQARSIAASLPVRTAEGRTQSQAIRAALEPESGLHKSDRETEQDIRAACIDGLTMLTRVRDEPQETEAVLIRVAMWLTMVGLAASYVISVVFDNVTSALIAGALGGMLGSLSNLLLHHRISLGMIVLAPVAGALNATGGLLLVSFLAQDEIQVLGKVFQQAWISPTSLTSLAVALLLGFFGGMFARIAVAGAAPLLGSNAEAQKGNSGNTEDDNAESSELRSGRTSPDIIVNGSTVTRPRPIRKRSIR